MGPHHKARLACAHLGVIGMDRCFKRHHPLHNFPEHPFVDGFIASIGGHERMDQT